MTTMLLEWVATAVFLMLAVLALRAVFGRRVGAGLRYALWGAVLLRLLIPVQLFTSPLAGTRVFFDRTTEQNIYKVTGDGPEQGGPEDIQATGKPDGLTVGVQSPSVIVPPAVPNLPDAPQAPQAPEAPGPDWSGWVWLGAAWLAGSAVTALVFLGCNLRFWRRLRRTRAPLEEERTHGFTTLPVYTAEGLPSPCLFGLVRPAIYVTPETAADPAALRHVLAHEDTHFRHGDHIWNLLRCAALCLHWWNPLVWLSAALSRRDGELACDEGALKRLGDGERAAYGNTLLTLITAPTDPGSLLRCATTMAGDKKSLVERVSRIAHAPKKWLWAAVAVALCLALACVCAFGQKAEEPEPANWSGLPAELTFSLESFDDGRPYVRMNGTVDGMELPRGAAWDPNSTWGRSPSGELSMVYPGFEGLGKHVDAWWEDESRTSVTLTTFMGAGFSSLFNVGYWEFTVDLDSGTLTSMERLPRDGLLDEETVFYPESISDEEAVRAARVAAKLMEEAEACYNRIKPWDTPGPSKNVPGEAPEGLDELLAHFTADTSGVPDDVLYTIGNWVREKYEAYPAEMAAAWAEPLPGRSGEVAAFDDWRVEALAGPWTKELDGTLVELWQINYEFHTTEPEKAEDMIVGGMYLTEDNWLCPTYNSCTYLVFQTDNEGGRAFLTDMMINDCGPDSPSELFYETVAKNLEYKGLLSAESLSPEETSNPPETPDPEETDQPEEMGHFAGLAQAMAEEAKPRLPAEDVADMTELPWHPDLNRNGVSERLLQGQYYLDRQQTASMPGVGVWEGNELLWTSTNKDTPSSSWAFLLLKQEGGDLLERGDYLMEYRAWIGNNDCTYDFIVYDLTGETGYYVDGTGFYYSSAEGVAQVFDAEAIAAFKGKADALLSKGSVLMDTPGIFTGKKLKMDLSWLDFYAAGFTWDDSATDLENLTRFRDAATDPQQSSNPDTLVGPHPSGTELLDALLGEAGFTYCAPGSPAQAEISSVAHMAFESLSDEWGKIYEFSLADLDGNGIKEVVLHVIDAAGDAGGYLILRCVGPGDVRCYSLTTYDFRELKADGTFGYATLHGMMGDPGGYGRASFPAPGYSLVTHSLMEGKMGWSIGPAYYINGQEVTDEEYAAAKVQQDAKPDAAWYEFTPENIKTVLG